MNIIGISAFYHDSAACLIQNGKIVAAAQEERFTRKKHDPAFPENAIKFCLEEGRLKPSNIDAVVFYEKPILKFERLLETYLAFVPRGFSSFKMAMPVWLNEKIFQKSNIIKSLKNCLGGSTNWQDRLFFSDHHLSHAASAFYPSPFKSAVIITIDGVGEWATTSIYYGENKKITPIKEINFPHSLGLLYSAFTYYAGFKVNSGEYKLMGLAPYGRPIYSDLIEEKLINVEDDGSFQLNLEYFDFCTGLTMTNKKFDQLFDGVQRHPETEITQPVMDIAASIQKVVEGVILKIAKNAKIETKAKNLCLAGGVALNCVANGVLANSQIFDGIWVQPASGDAGGAIGAALAFHHNQSEESRRVDENTDSMSGALLGPKFSNDSIEKQLNELGAVYTRIKREELSGIVATFIADGKAVGLMQGRMEFGPRALGARSIIADPRSPVMQRQLNLKVKFRESFRPFAPSVLEEFASGWFDFPQNYKSPYMLFVARLVDEKIKPMSKTDEGLFGIDKLNVVRSAVPAITHVDYSARLQTVNSRENPIYHSIIKRFYELTGCPMVVNTSFNVRGEPIVCNPSDAYKCFMGTGLDILVVEDFVLKKCDQPVESALDYRNKYSPD